MTSRSSGNANADSQVAPAKEIAIGLSLNATKLTLTFLVLLCRRVFTEDRKGRKGAAPFSLPFLLPFLTPDIDFALFASFCKTHADSRVVLTKEMPAGLSLKCVSRQKVT